MFAMLAAAVNRITADPTFAEIPPALRNMRAVLVLRRDARPGVYAQGTWRPRVGGALNFSVAPNWETQVAEQGHAVLAGHPVVHVLTRDATGRLALRSLKN